MSTDYELPKPRSPIHSNRYITKMNAAPAVPYQVSHLIHSPTRANAGIRRSFWLITCRPLCLALAFFVLRVLRNLEALNSELLVSNRFLQFEWLYQFDFCFFSIAFLWIWIFVILLCSGFHCILAAKKLSNVSAFCVVNLALPNSNTLPISPTNSHTTAKTDPTCHRFASHTKTTATTRDRRRR